jgi:hypothetical protein
MAAPIDRRGFITGIGGILLAAQAPAILIPGRRPMVNGIIRAAYPFSLGFCRDMTFCPGDVLRFQDGGRVMAWVATGTGTLKQGAPQPPWLVRAPQFEVPERRIVVPRGT